MDTISTEISDIQRRVEILSPASDPSTEKTHTGTLMECESRDSGETVNGSSYTGEQVKGGRGYGCLTETAHNRQVKGLRGNYHGRRRRAITSKTPRCFTSSRAEAVEVVSTVSEYKLHQRQQ